MSADNELAHALAGAGGGALSMVVTYPLVTLSTLAQTTQKKKEHESETPTKVLSNSAALEILKKKGILGLYSGLESALYGITLSNFIYYYFYEFTSNVFLRANVAAGRRKRGLLTFQLIITGAIAGAITVVGTNPFWVANTRMMTKAKELNTSTHSTVKTILEIIETDGVSTLFAGVLPALVLVINPIIQYTIFEQVKNVIIAANGAASFSAIKAFFIGAFGKLVATSLTYPYITLKSRMHVKKKKLETETDAEIQLSMVQEIKKIVKEEGLEGLYRGLGIKLFQSISTAAFLFYFKEELLAGSVLLVQILQGAKLRRQLK